MILKIGNVCLILFLSLIVSFLGCSTVDVREGPAPGVRIDDSRAPNAGIRYNTAVIIDKSLQQWDGKVFDPSWSSIFSSSPKERDRHSKIAIESTNSKRTPTNTLEVWAVLRNRTDYPLQIEARTQFFDSNKVPIEGPTAWQRVHLPPQSLDTYREFSTKTGEISYYYIEIREGR
jgi:hypothetical protein